MATWIGFLRAINLGATRKFPKDAILASVERAGGTDIATHLNTGNVRLDHDLTVRADIEAALEEEFRRDRGFEVPTICLSPGELSAVARDAERLAEGHTGQYYVSFLKTEPSPEAVAELEARSTAAEVVKVGGRAVHLLLGENYHEARLTNNVVERVLGVATNRNLRVVRTLASKWGSG